MGLVRTPRSRQLIADCRPGDSGLQQVNLALSKGASATPDAGSETVAGS